METRIYEWKSDYPTEERRKEFICESFKVDKNEILNQDEKLKEEIVRYGFRISFLVWQQILNITGPETDVLELIINEKRSEKMKIK